MSVDYIKTDINVCNIDRKRIIDKLHNLYFIHLCVLVEKMRLFWQYSSQNSGKYMPVDCNPYDILKYNVIFTAKFPSLSTVFLGTDH